MFALLEHFLLLLHAKIVYISRTCNTCKLSSHTQRHRKHHLHRLIVIITRLWQAKQDDMIADKSIVAKSTVLCLVVTLRLSLLGRHRASCAVMPADESKFVGTLVPTNQTDRDEIVFPRCNQLHTHALCTQFRIIARTTALYRVQVINQKFDPFRDSSAHFPRATDSHGARIRLTISGSTLNRISDAGGHEFDRVLLEIIPCDPVRMPVAVTKILHNCQCCVGAHR